MSRTVRSFARYLDRKRRDGEWGDDWASRAPKAYRRKFLEQWRALCRAAVRDGDPDRCLLIPDNPERAGWWYW